MVQPGLPPAVDRIELQIFHPGRLQAHDNRIQHPAWPPVYRRDYTLSGGAVTDSRIPLVDEQGLTPPHRITLGHQQPRLEAVIIPPAQRNMLNVRPGLNRLLRFTRKA
jgi:hypothetical protein